MQARPDARKRVPAEGPRFRGSTSIGNLPKDCTISLCSNTPCLWQRAEISAIGWITPVSLFAVMIDTRVVSGRIAPSSCSGSTKPSPDRSSQRDLETFPLFKMLQRVQDGMMFGAVADQMLSLWCETPGETEEREIVRFRAAARKNDFVRFRA